MRAKNKITISIITIFVIATSTLYLNGTNPCSNEQATGVSFGECQALVDLYYATDGDAWIDNANWLNFDEPISHWDRVSVSNGSVYSLQLFSNNLNGMIPDTFSELTNLEYLHLADNNLTGEVPDLSSMQSLVYVILSKNNLSGDVYPQLFPTQNLEFLALSKNCLEISHADVESFVNYGFQIDPESINLLPQGGRRCADYSEIDSAVDTRPNRK